jgi:cobalt-zinc-cadmium efflux system protein
MQQKTHSSDRQEQDRHPDRGEDPASCTHDHTHPAVTANRMALAVGLTLGFVILEAGAGLFAKSLALLSDAGHNFADAAALGFSWYALWIARKPSHARMTFGYHRVGILAALVNAASLVVIATAILFEGIIRLRYPQAAHGWVMVGVAAVAVAMNFTIGSWLHAGSHHDLNVRSARLHMMGDAISAIGVVLAGLVVAMSGATIADPIISFIIAGLILVSCWGVLRESVTVLLEGTPAGMNMQTVERDISAVPGVRGVHDLHVWTVGAGVIAASVHIVVDEETILGGQRVLRSVALALQSRHRINHSTIQVEVEAQCADGMYCCIEPGEAHAGHRH